MVDKKYLGSAKATDQQTGKEEETAFVVEGKSYADAFANAIEFTYDKFPPDQYTDHKCQVVQRGR